MGDAVGDGLPALGVLEPTVDSDALGDADADTDALLLSLALKETDAQGVADAVMLPDELGQLDAPADTDAVPDTEIDAELLDDA